MKKNAVPRSARMHARVSDQATTGDKSTRGGRARTAFAVALVSGFAVAAHAQMAMPGQFGVQPSGSAAYSIPIQVPPGIAGMAPKLSLNFDSRARNGQVGVGWNLGGQSAISRCAQTLPQDGARTGVSFSASDRYCMDGQRLVLTSGTYGSPGATYATEVDTFTRVVQGGTAAVPTFTAQSRDGTSREYGGTSDSRVMATGSSTIVRLWAIDKVSDPVGNYMSYAYTADPTVGGYYLASISYTGNPNAVPPVAPMSKVVFSYDTSRTDMKPGYVAGYAIGNRALLKTIATYSGALNVLNYNLTYEDGYDTGRKRLTAVQVCDGTGTTCLAKTTMAFKTTSAAGAVKEPIIATGSSGTAGNTPDQDPQLEWSMWAGFNWFSYDFDGNGRVGFVHFSGSDGPVDMKLWHSKGDGTFAVTTGLKLFGNFGTQAATALYPADVNGDGVPDIMAKIIGVFDSSCPQGGINYRKGIYLNDGLGNYSTLPTFAKACVDGIDFVEDMNGDGMTDVVHLGLVSPRTIDVALAVGDGTFASQATTTTTIDTASTGTWQQLDLNGDGIPDLVHFVDGSGNYFVWTATNSGSFNVVKAPASTVDKTVSTGTWLVMDVNGDGLMDLVHITTTSGASQGTAYVWMNQGNGTFAVTAVTTTVDKVAPVRQTYSDNNMPSNADAWLIADYNGDGRADIIHAADGAGTFYVWLSNGDGTFNISAHKRTDDVALTTGVWKGADITGTGVVDFLHFSTSVGTYQVWSMPRVDRDVPLSINNGAGATYGWTLKSLPQILNADATHGGSYLRAAATPYPATLTTVVPPLLVVTDSYVPDGHGGQRHTGYNYGSARMDRSGRGFLGFEWFETIDVLTSMTSRTTYAQSFPYTGMVAATGSGTSHVAPNSLTSSVNTLSCMNPGAATAGTPCSGAGGGARYYPFVTNSDVSATDLDGVSKLPMKRTTVAIADLDLFGNPKKTTSTTLNADGSASTQDVSSITSNTYDNDVANWRLGRLVKSVVQATGPTVPASVTPGQGSSVPPAAPTPRVPAAVILPVILSILLSD